MAVLLLLFDAAAITGGPAGSVWYGMVSGRMWMCQEATGKCQALWGPVNKPGWQATQSGDVGRLRWQHAAGHAHSGSHDCAASK